MLLITIFQAIFSWLLVYVTMQFGRDGVRKLYREMIYSISKAPINLYFDKTPVGRILKRFTSDLSVLEELLHWKVSFWIRHVF